jgi:hypothetical protein
MHWHDSKLVGFQLAPKSGERYDFNVDLRLLTNAQPGQYSWKDARLQFQYCRIIELSVDLLGIRFTGGDIASAFCEGGAELKEKLESRFFDLPQGDDPYEGILHFRILLIPPGGEINVFARNFAMID